MAKTSRTVPKCLEGLQKDPKFLKECLKGKKDTKAYEVQSNQNDPKGLIGPKWPQGPKDPKKGPKMSFRLKMEEGPKGSKSSKRSKNKA